jgi:flagellar hook-length control protein FliK
MTSGVKQALPQVLMPKAGVEGKATRNRAPQGDFAEALGIGKSSKQPKSAEAKADRQEIEVKPSWQRLAVKLETAAEHSKVIAAKLEAAALSEEPEAEEPTDDKLDKLNKGDRVEDMAAPPVAHPPVDAAQAPIPPIASSSIPATIAEPTEATPQHDAAVFREEPPPPAKPNVIVDGRKASPPASSEVAGQQDSAAPIFIPMGRGEQAESIRFEPAVRSTAPAEPTDGSQASDAMSDNAAEPARTTPRVTVLAQQNIPAPMPSTAIVLVESIAASDLLEPARTVLSFDAIHASAAPASAQSLKIQLHPAELGMVTATLRFAGEQLSVELQVENHGAYRRLTSDSDTIVSSLRDLGYDIERVTVLQPPLAATPANRSDTGASMPSPQGRAPEQPDTGTTSGGNGGTGGRQPENGGTAGRHGPHHPAAAKENTASGLYI